MSERPGILIDKRDVLEMTMFLGERAREALRQANELAKKISRDMGGKDMKKLVKIYSCKDKEHYDYLANKLEERGWKWADEDNISDYNPYDKQEVPHDAPIAVYGYDDMEIKFDFSGYIWSDEPKVIDVSLPKPKPETKSEPEAKSMWICFGGVQDCKIDTSEPKSDDIRPEHYQHGEMDRFEVWYRTLPFNEFRAAMKCVADRYLWRYDRKDGRKGLKKAMETLRRLGEYEKREGNE